MKPLKIDKDFQSLIPPLSNEELKGLEESILTHGRCHDTIKVWRNTIVDGHNRYTICQKHNIPVSTQKLRFSSKKDAELWIVQNQLGRRNLVNAVRIKLALRKETLLQEKAGKNRRGCNGDPIHVRKIIAKEAGVSEQSVYKYMKIRELGTPGLIKQVESGQVRISTAHREVTGLEVTTRTVEVLYDEEDPPDIANPLCETAVIIKLEKLAKLYYFISDNAACLKLGDCMLGIQKMLRLHLAQLSARCG